MAEEDGGEDFSVPQSHHLEGLPTPQFVKKGATALATQAAEEKKRSLTPAQLQSLAKARQVRAAKAQKRSLEQTPLVEETAQLNKADLDIVGDHVKSTLKKLKDRYSFAAADALHKANKRTRQSTEFKYAIDQSVAAAFDKHKLDLQKSIEGHIKTLLEKPLLEFGEVAPTPKELKVLVDATTTALKADGVTAQEAKAIVSSAVQEFKEQHAETHSASTSNGGEKTSRGATSVSAHARSNNRSESFEQMDAADGDRSRGSTSTTSSSAVRSSQAASYSSFL